MVERSLTCIGIVFAFSYRIFLVELVETGVGYRKTVALGFYHLLFLPINYPAYPTLSTNSTAAPSGDLYYLLAASSINGSIVTTVLVAVLLFKAYSSTSILLSKKDRTPSAF